MSFKAVKTNQHGLYSDKFDIGIAESAVNDSSLSNYIVQIYIFYGDNFLGWDCFQKDKILIGSNENADLILAGDGVQEFHATAYVRGDQVIISDKTDGNGLIVNKTPVKNVILGNFDFIKIGPYSIKIKVKLSDDSIEEDAFVQKSDKGFNVENKIEKKLPELENEIVVVESATDDMKVSEIYKKKVVTQAPAAEDPVEVIEITVHEEKQKGPFKDTHEDFVPYTNGKKYNLICDGKIAYGRDPRKVRENLSKLLKSSEAKVNRLLSGSTTILKKNINYKTAEKFRKRLEKAGILISIEEFVIKNTENVSIESIDDVSQDSTPEFEKPEKRLNPFYMEEIDEDEEDLEADFSLLEKILNHGLPEDAFFQNQQNIVEVIKYKSNQIVDVSYLEVNDQYKILHDNHSLCLVENTGEPGCFFYFKDQFSGVLKNANHTEIELHNLKNPENFVSNRTGLYRDALQAHSKVILEDGLFEYHIQLVKQGKVKTAKELPRKKIPFKQFLLKSFAFHLVVIVIAGIVHLVKPESPEKLPETYFVRMSIDNLADMDKKKVIPKKLPRKKVQKVREEKKATPSPEKKVSKKRTPKKQTKTVSKKSVNQGKNTVSRSPKAGGGFGKGNVSNRNINEAGILGMLGSSIAPSSKNAIAAVTNLDAVSTSNSTSGDFKVGGIVGKLGSSRISVTTPGPLGTKGSKQVLRSFGAKGEGSVVALEKGKTGQKQVVGMVKASLSKKVRVQGGMSREAVKKVIDAHLDEISYCYETALLSNPSIIGKVVFEWKILASGRVGEVKIKSSSINSNQIHSCIKSCIKSWQFPEPSGSEVVVSYPFIFDIVGF